MQPGKTKVAFYATRRNQAQPDQNYERRLFTFSFENETEMYMKLMNFINAGNRFHSFFANGDQVRNTLIVNDLITVFRNKITKHFDNQIKDAPQPLSVKQLLSEFSRGKYTSLNQLR